MYCPNCKTLIHSTKCPVCGNKHIREPQDKDYCFLCEKDVIWANALKDILAENQIPCIVQNTLGDGLAARIGPAQERIRFYVPYCFYQAACDLDREFFPES